MGDIRRVHFLSGHGSGMDAEITGWMGWSFLVNIYIVAGIP
jgi:hypothetical protein